eukprot:SAG31_NODE_661_length_13035_cov_12.057591_2_plen_171_part_00
MVVSDTCHLPLALHSLRTQLPEATLTEMRLLPVRDRIRIVVEARLQLLLPQLNHWPTAVGVLAQPQNLQASINTATATVDAMWALIDSPTVEQDENVPQEASATFEEQSAGQATSPPQDGPPMDWGEQQARRALLGAVYASTELFLLTDAVRFSAEHNWLTVAFVQADDC